MIGLLIALQVMEAQPIVRPNVTTAVRPNMAVMSVSPKQQKLADARALLADAVKVQSSYAPKAGQPSKAELDRKIERMEDEIDSMSEMGEMESLRLQMAMDRMSKMMSTLSNLLKKMSDTASQITQNMK